MPTSRVLRLRKEDKFQKEGYTSALLNIVVFRAITSIIPSDLVVKLCTNGFIIVIMNYREINLIN